MNEPDDRAGGCPDAETLALLVERQLDEGTRRLVLSHVADCPSCREVYVELGGLLADTADAPPAPSRRVIPWTPLGLAAAAMVILGLSWFMLVQGGGTSPAGPIDHHVERLVASLGETRTVEARLSAPFAWAPLIPPARGGADVEISVEARQAALALEALARDDRTADTLAAAGMAKLAVGETDAAIDLLEEANELEPSHARARSDLSAAYLTRWRRQGDAASLSSALNAAEAALAIAPQFEPALFNKALALEALGVEGAEAAWDACLAVARDAGWRQEAEAHLTRLRQRRSSSREAGVPDVLTASASDLTTIAERAPADLEAAISNRVLRGLTSSGDGSVDPPAMPVDDMVSALVAADRDRFWPGVVHAAAAVRAGSPAAVCLRDALTAIHSARARFDESDYVTAERDADRAVTALACAGSNTLEGVVQRGWAAFFRGERDAAVRELTPLLDEARRTKQWRSLARIQYLTGIQLVAATRPDAALAAYAEAMEAARRAGDPELVALVATMQAEAFRSIGEPAMAWEAQAVALPLLLALSPRRVHIVLAGAVLTAAQAGHRHAAAVFADELAAAAASSSDPARRASAFIHQARTRLELERPAAAAEALALAEVSIGEIGNETLRDQFATDARWLRAMTHRTTDPAEALRHMEGVFDRLAATGRSYRLAEILLERGRVRLATGDRAGAVDDWVRGVSHVESETAAIADRQARISRSSRVWDLYGELIEANAQDPLRALSFAERSRARALQNDVHRTIALQAPATDLAAIPHDVDVLYYAVLREALVVWHVSRDGVRTVRQTIRPLELGQLVVRFLGSPRGDDARRLASLLLPDTIVVSPARRLVFVPDGILHGLPFSILPDPGSHRPLFEVAVTMVTPSLAIARRQRVTMAAGRVLLAGVGTRRPAEGLEALPGVDEEISTLVRLHGSAAVTRLIDGDVTAPRLLEELRHTRLFHFAGHAVANQQYPARSRLVLGADDERGRLTAEEISRTSLQPGAIVVLSACDTARGRVYRGEGAMGLAHAFLAAGAGAVVATLWQLPDGQGTPLLQAFHQGLIAGKDPAQALTDAKRAAAGNGVDLRALGVFELITSSLRESRHGRVEADDRVS